jgi:hypothetical protein
MTAASKNVVASVLARLRNIAESGGLSFNDILQSYVSERFLARLARSSYADGLLLKGALAGAGNLAKCGGANAARAGQWTMITLCCSHKVRQRLGLSARLPTALLPVRATRSINRLKI